jgi:hypothetical protein
MGVIRARGLNPVKTGNYFIDLADILNKNDLLHKPQTIWNMDEKGVSMEHTPVKVVADLPTLCSNCNLLIPIPIDAACIAL